MHSEIAASYGLGSGAIVELAASPSVRSEENIGRNAKAPALPLNLSRVQLALPAQYGVHHALRADLRQVRLAQLTLHHQELHHLGWGCAWDLMVLFVIGANQIAHDKQQGIQRARVVAAIGSIKASLRLSISLESAMRLIGPSWVARSMLKKQDSSWRNRHCHGVDQLPRMRSRDF